MTAIRPTESNFAALTLASGHFWPETLGCSPYVTDLAIGLVERGVAVKVLAGQPHYPRKSAYVSGWSQPPAALEMMEIRRLAMFDRSSGTIRARLVNHLTLSAQLAIAIRRSVDRSDAVLALAQPALVVAAIRAAGWRGRLVALVHDIESGLACATGVVRHRHALRLLERVEAWCLNLADAVVVLTPSMKNALEALGVSRPIKIIPIWARVEAQSSPSVKRPPTVMYSGGLSRRHGIDLLPEIWRALLAAHPTVKLIVQGDGIERDRIHAALHEIGGALEIRGPVPAETLSQSLAEADLQLVLQAEGAADYSMPSKAVTSLAAGVPFLCNAHEGSDLHAFATASGGAELVPSGTPEALAAAAVRLLRNPDALRRKAHHGLGFVQDGYSRSGRIDAFLAVCLDKQARSRPVKSDITASGRRS